MDSKNADLYKLNHKMQTRDGLAFLELVVEVLLVKDLSNEVVLDIGCGPGTYCTDFMFKRFPKLKKFIGIDSNQAMIQQAKESSIHSNAEYYVMDFENDPILNVLTSGVSVILSLFTLHWMKDQNLVLKRIFDLLEPGGDAALYFVLTIPYWDCLISIQQHPKWKQLIQDLDSWVPNSHHEHYDDNHYQKVLESIGFDIILCETVSKVFKYHTEESLKGFMMSICPYVSAIPSDRLDEFKEDLFQESKKFIKDSSTVPYKCIQIIVNKPQ